MGVAVGLGVRVGVNVAVGTTVLVAVGCGVSVGAAVGAMLEQADTSRVIDKNNKMILKLKLCCIYPPCCEVVSMKCIIDRLRK